MRDPLQAPPMLSQIMAGDGIPWARLVTAIVLVGLSLAIGYRSGREPPPADAVPQAVPERVVEGFELPPLRLAAATPPLPFVSGAAPAGAASLTSAPGAAPHRPAQRRQFARAPHGVPERQVARSRRDGLSLASSEARANRGGGRTREEVRREYLRNRDVVAALTGEDSGSAYLTRVAARARAVRPEDTGRRRG